MTVNSASGSLSRQSAPVLAARGVHVSFGGLVAVDRVDLELQQHEIVAIIGANGAGKSTFLNAICGIVPMRGTLEIGGVRVSPVRPRTVARLGLARAFQSPPLIDGEPLLENALCGAFLRAKYSAIDQLVRPRRAARSEAALTEELEELLAYAGLGDLDGGSPAGHLAHGVRKRVDIVRALMHRPSVLALDEPTSGMVEEERDSVQRLIRWARDHYGTTVLLVEHHMDVVRGSADRVIALETGKIRVSGTPGDVLASEEATASAGTLAASASPEAARGEPQLRSAEGCRER